MALSSNKRRLVALLVAACLCIHLVACGTILYPERRGQPAGRLDPGVVLLDGLGLILFLVPGVVAFVVDFTTGTIYLPYGGYADGGPVPSNQDLRTVRMSPAEITPQRLEAVIQEKAGCTVHLQPGTYRAAKLNNIQDFSPATVEQLQSSPTRTDVLFGDRRD